MSTENKSAEDKKHLFALKAIVLILLAFGIHHHVDDWVSKFSAVLFVLLLIEG